MSTTVTDFDGARVGEGSEEVLDDGSETVRGGGGDVKGDEEDDQKDVTSVSTRYTLSMLYKAEKSTYFNSSPRSIQVYVTINHCT